MHVENTHDLYEHVYTASTSVCITDILRVYPPSQTSERLKHSLTYVKYPDA